MYRSFRSVNPFLHSTPFTQPPNHVLYNAFNRPDTQKCPFPLGICTPSNTWFTGPTHPNQHLKLYIQPFLRSPRQRIPILYNGQPLFHLKIVPLYMGDSFGSPESSSRTASRSVQSLFAGLTVVTDRQTDRLTDDAAPSVATGRI